MRIGEGLTEDELRGLTKALTYESKKNKYDYQRFKHNKFLKMKMGIANHNKACDKLLAKVHLCLLGKDDQGYFTYSGLSNRLEKLDFKITKNIIYPNAELVPFLNMNSFKLRDYQEDFISSLLIIKHGAIELATGGGKSLGILVLAKRLGLKTVIMTPSESICLQIYDLFVTHFGKRYVGMYGAGKKQFNKLFTVGIAQSLTRLEPEDEAYQALSKADVFISDESHLTAAETLAKVCFGLCSKAPYRFFLSGTNMRNDGADLLLEAIIGPIVYKLGSQELIDRNVLAKPYFYMINTSSQDSFQSQDAMAMIRQHYLRNPNIYENVDKILTKIQDKQILILIDEIDQYQMLLNALESSQSILLVKGGDDTSTLVKDFNNKKIRILVGTDCISTGTDLFPDVLILIKGGKSPIEFRQAVGRGLRRTPEKSEVLVFDFNISNIELLDKHSEERVDIYRSIYNNLKYLDESVL